MSGSVRCSSENIFQDSGLRTPFLQVLSPAGPAWGSRNLCFSLSLPGGFSQQLDWKSLGEGGKGLRNCALQLEGLQKVKMEVSGLCSLKALFAFCLGCVHNKKIDFF